MEEIGMTNAQYKGLLLDELEDWEEILALAQEGKNPQIIRKAERHIQKIRKKLKLRTQEIEDAWAIWSCCRMLLRTLRRMEVNLDAGEIDAMRALRRELREDTEKDIEA